MKALSSSRQVETWILLFQLSMLATMKTVTTIDAFLMASPPSLSAFKTTKGKVEADFVSQGQGQGSSTVAPVATNSATISGTKLYSSATTIEITTKTIQLSTTGTQAEVMSCKPTYDQSPKSSLQMVLNSSSKPPLIFIHGSFHASWCWAEHYFEYFCKLGYSCYALSLRGTGGTYAGDDVNRVKIREHVGDISAFLDYVKEEEGYYGNDYDRNGDRDTSGERDHRSNTGPGKKLLPVLIAHSFGGLAVMKYLEEFLYFNKSNGNGSGASSHMPGFLSDSAIPQTDKDLPLPLSGVVMLCSVPPSGNGKMTMRFLKRSWRDSWKITAGLALRKCIVDEKLCRQLFFNSKNSQEGDLNGISEDDLRRYQSNFKRDTVATIDLRDLAKRLPSANINEQNGNALFVEEMPPALVIGAKDDFIVDTKGVVETANYFGVEPVCVDSPHDVMLGSKWKNAADVIQTWLEEDLK